MKNFETLGCKRSDCRFTITDRTKTAAYTVPLYDREGNNIASDLNIETGKICCQSCERSWKFIESYNGTYYEELK